MAKKVAKKSMKKAKVKEFYVDQLKYERAVELADGKEKDVRAKYELLGGLVQEGHGYKEIK